LDKSLLLVCPHLEIWFDRPLAKDLGVSFGVSPHGFPQVVTSKSLKNIVAELLPTISLATLASSVQTAPALMQGKATLAPLHVVCLVGSDS